MLNSRRPWFARRSHCRRTALALCAIAALLFGNAKPVHAQSASYHLPKTPNAPELLIFPPRNASAPRPVVVMLHGMCDTPENECPRLADALAEKAWLVCPRGNLTCNSGGASWSFSRRTRVAEQALSALRELHPREIDDAAGHTLAGFSLGAFAAVDASNQGAGSFRYLMLIGAKVQPSAVQLQQAGIHSVILMAGEWDMTFAHMNRQALWLTRQGIPSRFIGLGPVGHTFPSDINRRLRNALDFFSSPEYGKTSVL